MIQLFFIVNIGMALITLLSISMLQNHFKRINKCIERYANRKVYKQQEETRFISILLERYNVIASYQNNNIDIRTLVTKAFYEEKIGKFKYTIIESIALKGKLLIWGTLIGQILIEVITEIPPYPREDVIIIIANTLLCMLITLVGVIKGIVEEKRKLINKLADYVVNTYPAEMQWEKQQEDIKKLHEKIEVLQDELQEYKEKENVPSMEKAIEQPKEKELLKEKDIIKLLEKFNLIS